MITLSDDGVVKITTFANPFIDNSNLQFILFLTKQTWVMQGTEWVEVTDARKEKWRKIIIDNSNIVDYTSGLFAVQDEDGNYPATSIGAYYYICGIKLNQLGEPDSLAYVGMAKQIEDFLINNNLVTVL